MNHWDCEGTWGTFWQQVSEVFEQDFDFVILAKNDFVNFLSVFNGVSLTNGMHLYLTGAFFWHKKENNTIKHLKVKGLVSVWIWTSNQYLKALTTSYGIWLFKHVCVDMCMCLFTVYVCVSKQGRYVTHVDLVKPLSGGLGFSVVGLRDENQGELGIFVQEIQIGSVAHW